MIVLVVYQIAMLTGLAAECTATYSLSKYQTLKHNFHVQSTMLSPSSPAFFDQSALNSSAISTIVFCVLVATLFGADFFFLVFWPARRYPRWYVSVKELLAVVITAGMGASAIVSTWVIATQQARVSGVDQATTTRILQLYFRPPVVYHHWAQNIAWVVLLWIAFLSTVASTVLMFISAQHDARFGPHNNASPDEKGISTDTEENAPITAGTTGTPSARDSMLSNEKMNGTGIGTHTQSNPTTGPSHSIEESNATRLAQGGSGHPTTALNHVQLPLREGPEAVAQKPTQQNMPDPQSRWSNDGEM